MLNVALALPVLGARSTLIRFGNSLLVVNQQAVASMVRFSKERPWSRPTYTGRASATLSQQLASATRLSVFLAKDPCSGDLVLKLQIHLVDADVRAGTRRESAFWIERDSLGSDML